MARILITAALISFIFLCAESAHCKNKAHGPASRYSAAKVRGCVEVTFAFGRHYKPPEYVSAPLIISDLEFRELDGTRLESIEWKGTRTATGPVVILILRIKGAKVRKGIRVDGRMYVNGRWWRVNACLLPRPDGKGWIVTPPFTLGCMWRVKREEDY